MILDRVKDAVRAAVELGKKHPEAELVFSGRWSYKSDIEYPVTEAGAMARYAIEIGASPDRVSVEEKSFDTLSNFLYTKDILKKHGWHNVIIVAASDHGARMDYIARLVFGPEYLFEIAAVPHGLSGEDYKASVAREAKSLDIINRAVEKAHVEPGDDKALWRAMHEFHPVFAQDFSVARRRLLEEMGEV
jgi:uncharacterized SAM-binding protein YcdF (DUF218 family)